ncbi:MAG: tRNA (guanosine(37)-N1)-methyltransferase TrmD [Pseudomonadota bacterium]
MKQAGIITLFPDMFSALTEYGVTGRACRGGQVSVECWNPRDFTTDRHRTVDDRPFGGGAGMLMKTDPLRAAIRHARERMPAETPVIYLSPQGRTLDHEGVGELARRDSLILLCGRYQGMDERVLSADVDEEWSIGDYVLSGGELAAMVLLDAVMRQQPGVLGHEDSVTQDSFATGLLHCPQYTRPRVIDGQGVPDVLLGGDHEQIRRWQLKQSLGRTWQRRPELLSARELTEEQQKLLNEFISEHAGAYGDEQKQDYRAD